jgi:hypothetical protein
VAPSEDNRQDADAVSVWPGRHVNLGLTACFALVRTLGGLNHQNILLTQAQLLTYSN